MAEHVPGQPYRYHHGWIPAAGANDKPKFPEIRKADLSTPDGRRSRAVSSAEFQRLAAKGEKQYGKLADASSPSIFEKGSPAQRAEIMNRAFTESRDPWGGSTIDAHSGEFLAGDADKYAITVRPPGMDTVSVDPKASPAEFRKAFQQATEKYKEILARRDHHLGVFHDADKGTIDIDPVFVTADKTHVETIGSYTHAVGGAYHFKSGDGFWPPHVKETK